MPLATRTRPRSDVSVNLLPSQLQAQQRARSKYRLAAGGAIALGVLLIAVTVLQRMQIGDAKDTLAREQRHAASLQQQVNKLSEFGALQDSITSTRTVLATALHNDIAWSRLLDDLDTAIPGDAWVTGLTMAATLGTTPLGDTSLGTVQYTGVVKSFPGLSGWLDTIENLDGQRFVYLTNGNKQEMGGQKVVAFSASSHMTESMLSGRCQKEGAPCP